MSIVYSNKFGWVLCHSSFLCENYGNIGDINCCSDCKRFKIFHITSQFLRPNQKTSNFNSSKSRRRGRDKDVHPSAIEVHLREIRFCVNSYDFQFIRIISSLLTYNGYLKSIVFQIRRIQRDFENFLCEAERQKLTYFQIKCPLDQTRNSIAVDAAQAILNLTAFTKRPEFFRGRNTNTYPIVVQFQDQKFFVPRSCSFFSCDLVELTEKVESENFGQFDVIVLDPPWRNKHVRRKNEFNSCEGSVTLCKL